MSEQELSLELNTPAPTAPLSVEAPVVEVPNVGPVSMDELVKGYMRQSDYTQKTQALAQEKQDVEFASQLAKMFDEDPKQALTALAEEFNVTLAEAQQVAQAVSDDTSNEFKLPAEVADRLSRIDGFIAQAEQQRWQQQIDTEIAQVQEQFKQAGVEIDPVELLHYATTHQQPDLTEAAKGLSWEKQFGRGVQQGLTQVAAREEATVEGASGGAAGEPEVNSIADAWAAAKRMAGRS